MSLLVFLSVSLANIRQIAVFGNEQPALSNPVGAARP
jgi:hypothetical protein